MKSSYRRIGDFIKQISKKNSDGSLSEVLGVSIDKEFMPSVANLIGTDLKKYCVVSKGVFAFNPMHVGRDERLPIALYKKEDPALVSPAYFTFVITKPEELLPEYLELLCKTAQFDHLCWFFTDGSVRGGLSWDDFCNLEINVPDAKVQKKIVEHFNKIQGRILNLQAENGELERLGDVYLNDICVSEGEEDEDTNTYYLKDLCPIMTGKKDANEASGKGDIPFFTCSVDNLWTDSYSFDSNSVLVAGNGDFNVKHYKGRFEAYQRTYVLTPWNERYASLMFFVIKNRIHELTIGSRGSVISYITKDVLEDMCFSLAGEIKEDHLKVFNTITDAIDLNNSEILTLTRLKSTFLSNVF